jgi:hypothetical protein
MSSCKPGTAVVKVVPKLAETVRPLQVGRSFVSPVITNFLL